nr:hypothetical protein [Tanacetum cinerariifolium]
MSTQQDIYAAGSESRPPMLNKENYVSWSSRLLRYAKSRPNENLIHNSILNGPYVRRMIPEPGDANHEVNVTETFHMQTDDELSKKELKQIKADDQAIQTILLGLPEDIYAAVDSCETAQEIWFTSNEGESIESYYHRFLKLMNDLKRKKHFPEKIANNLKFLNNLQPEWSRHVTIVHQTKDLHTADYTQLYDFLKYNRKEVDELKAERLAKTQDPLALMANTNNPYAFPAPHQDQSSFNQNYLQQPMPNPEDITDPTNAMNMALALMAKAFKLNYSTPTNNNQIISLNPRNRQIAQLGQNARNLTGYNDVIGNQVIQNVVQNLRVQNVGNQNGLIGVQWNGNQNQIGNGNLVAARAEENTAGNQIRCYNYRGVEEYDLMVVAADLNAIKEVNANCILMANLQQASTSGAQTDSAPVYNSDGSAEVHNYENCYDNEIFNMFTQEEQYTKLLEPIPKSHQVPQNDNDVILEDTSVEQGGEPVEQHPANFEETRALYDSLYQNLATEVEKVNSNAGNPAGYNDVIGNQVIQNAVQNPKVQNVGNQNGLIGVQGNGNQNQIGNGNLVAARAEGNTAGNQIRCYNCRGVGHYARNSTVRPRRRDAAYLQTQLLIAQKEEEGIQLQAEEYDLMAATADVDEIKEVNANCILMANLQQALTLGTQFDSAPVYDSDGSAEYTELLEPIPESHQVPHNDNNVISEDTSVEQGGETVEQHPANFEETRALYESLYHNLAIEVEKVNSVNRKLKETNADPTIELARFKNQTRCFEISKEKYDKLERCYQQSVYQEQCLSKKINALHLSTSKQIMTLNEQISDINKQLSKEKSIVSFLLKEKKRLKSDLKTREDKLLDKQIQL